MNLQQITDLAADYAMARLASKNVPSCPADEYHLQKHVVMSLDGLFDCTEKEFIDRIFEPAMDTILDLIREQNASVMDKPFPPFPAQKEVFCMAEDDENRDDFFDSSRLFQKFKNDHGYSVRVILLEPDGTHDHRGLLRLDFLLKVPSDTNWQSWPA